MWLAHSVLSLVGAIVAHGLASRLLPGNVVAKFIGVGAIIGLALAGYEFTVFGLAPESVAAVLLYAFGCELYIFLFTLVSNSVSVGLLLALRAGTMSVDELEQRYSSSYMVTSRLQKLTTNGFLRRDGDAYLLTAKARALLARFRTLRGFFGHSPAPELQLFAGPGRPESAAVASSTPIARTEEHL